MLEDSSEAVKVLGVDQDLTLVLVVLLLTNLNQLKLKSIWIVDLGTLVGIGNEVEWWDLAVFFNPFWLHDEVVRRYCPTGELNELVEVLAKVLDNNFVVHKVFLVDYLHSQI